MATFTGEAARKDPKRPLTNTEYMNRFGNSAPWWLGDANHPYAPLNYAEFAMERTEAMRQLNYDGIFLYMYAGWTGLRGNPWRGDYPVADHYLLDGIAPEFLQRWNGIPNEIRERLLKSTLNYDPAAERMMINLLTQ
jgi:hypothetical protein